MVLKPSGSLASAKVPQPECLIPGARKGEMAIGRQDYIRYEVAVSMKSLLRDSVIANIIPGQFPDNKRLVTAGGQDHIRILGICGDLSHPSIVAPKGPSQLKGLGHGGALRHFLL